LATCQRLEQWSGSFLPRLIGGDLVLRLITIRVFGLLVLFRPLRDAEVTFFSKRVVTYDYLEAIKFSLSKKSNMLGYLLWNRQLNYLLLS
jgi:hypothetical protein